MTTPVALTRAQGLLLRLDLVPGHPSLAPMHERPAATPDHPVLIGRDVRALIEALDALREPGSTGTPLIRTRNLKEFVGAWDDLRRQWARKAVVLYLGSFRLADAQTAQAQEFLRLASGLAMGSPATVPGKPKPASPELRAARQRRDEILALGHFLTSEDIHLVQGGEPGAAGTNNTASRLRRARRLLGVWDGRCYRYPDFQLDEQTGRLREDVAELVALLPDDRSGWRAAFWLYQPHALLEGQLPVAVFERDPQAVIAAARASFEPHDTNW